MPENAINAMHAASNLQTVFTAKGLRVVVSIRVNKCTLSSLATVKFECLLLVFRDPLPINLVLHPASHLLALFEAGTEESNLI